MNQKITLYHGSEQIIESPTFGLGKQNNDFGLGFYCTESEELAKEWAVSSLRPPATGGWWRMCTASGIMIRSKQRSSPTSWEGTMCFSSPTSWENEVP